MGRILNIFNDRSQTLGKESGIEVRRSGRIGAISVANDTSALLGRSVAAVPTTLSPSSRSGDPTSFIAATPKDDI